MNEMMMLAILLGIFIVVSIANHKPVTYFQFAEDIFKEFREKGSPVGIDIMGNLRWKN